MPSTTYPVATALRRFVALGWALIALLALWFVPLARAAQNWVPTGMQAGQFTHITIDPATPGTLYALQRSGFYSASVVKSTDAGASWVEINNGLASPLIQDLVMDPSTPNTLYAATLSNEPFGNIGWGVEPKKTYAGGVFKSTDGGASWAAVNAGLAWPGMDSLNVWDLALDPTAPGTLYAGTWWGGAFKSTDGGASWTAVNTGLPGNASVFIQAVDPQAPGTVYATAWVEAKLRLFKSTNGGASWDLMGQDDGLSFISVFVDPTAQGALYATLDGSAMVARSTDGGATWTMVDAGLSHRAGFLAFDPATPGTIYAGTSPYSGGTGGGVFRSTDGGVSWVAVGLAGMEIVSLAIDPATRTLYAGTYRNGIFKSPVGPAPLLLPDSGEPVTLALPGGGGIEARSRQPGTQVQLIDTDSGPTVAVVTAGSARLQHSAAGQPVTALPRSGGLALLTPACAAARLTVTVTGNTRTVFSEGCPVALDGAGTQEPTMESPGNIPAQEVQVYAPGPLDQRSLLVFLDIAALAGGGDFNLYVLAFVPGGADHPQPVIMQRLATGGWAQLTIPAAAVLRQAIPQAPNVQVLIEVEKDSNLTFLTGTDIYIGYGLSEEEMLRAGRFRAVYRVQ